MSPRAKPSDTSAALRRRILKAYAARLREHGEPPRSLVAFCKELKISDRQFFSLFPTLEAVESAWWAGELDALIAAVRSGKEYASFNARQRMLTLAYAWLEKAPDLRVILLLRLGQLPPLVTPPFLCGFAERFKAHAREIVACGKESGEIAPRGRLEHLYPEGLYAAFRALVEFNLRDGSPRYERSDAFAEKAFALAFDVMGTQAVDSAFDLAKFLFPRPAAAA